MIVDPEKVAALIGEIAEEEIAARFGRLAAHEIDTKTSPNDFVTQADHAAEARLKQALAGVYPGAAFIGEELASANPLVLDHLCSEGAVWIVDPLDGTRNFVLGRREFGTIVALVEKGETRAGWIYAIPDHGFAMGSKGDGATWRGERLGPLAPASDPLTGFRAVGNMAEPWRDRLVPKLRDKYETETIRCSAYGYVHLLRGDRDFALYSRCWPWDHAAGILMLSEIDGRAEYLDDGAPYAPYATQGRPLLVAGGVDRWEKVRKTLQPRAAE